MVKLKSHSAPYGKAALTPADELKQISRRLRPSGFGIREPHKEESSLYDLYARCFSAMLGNPDPFVPILISLFAKGDSEKRIEELRKMVVLALLGTCLHNPQVVDFLRREFNRMRTQGISLSDRLQFTIPLNTKSG
ncbi:hypothetical protein HZC08_00165, partial [Candidatus Micrarchaeota archaeon]|nr:hypothetical protein [Candidatus Micrarchaeota archaeon]